MLPELPSRLAYSHHVTCRMPGGTQPALQAANLKTGALRSANAGGVVLRDDLLVSRRTIRTSITGPDGAGHRKPPHQFWHSCRCPALPEDLSETSTPCTPSPSTLCRRSSRDWWSTARSAPPTTRGGRIAELVATASAQRFNAGVDEPVSMFGMRPAARER